MLKKITLENLESSTAQEVFDFVAHHMLTQGERSEGHKNSQITTCLYRNHKGMACAAGCLMTAEQAAAADSLAESTWPDVVDESIATHVHMDLITGLQSIHDDRQPFAWREQLTEFAELWNVSSAILDTVEEA